MRLAGIATLLLASQLAAQDVFRVYPYIQNPATTAMTVLWFSNSATAGRLTVAELSGSTDAEPLTFDSDPQVATALAYPKWERDTFFYGTAPEPPYRHRVRVQGLQPGTSYSYRVDQEGASFSSEFRTEPGPDQALRLIFFADCETEPESTGHRVDWADPTGGDPERRYLLDQTEGFAANLSIIAARDPDFVAIAGDLVESGGEQRDWDEFWFHMTRADGSGLASRVPLLAALGNHEYYEGPKMGRYSQPASERASARYLSYFEYPVASGSPPEHQGRYYALDYGPVTLISLDVTNGGPPESASDTNFCLLGEMDPGGGGSPGFQPGSRQYQWLEQVLREAQERSAFTFVILHHVPYSVGPHGWPPGKGSENDTLRVALPTSGHAPPDESPLGQLGMGIQSVEVLKLLVSVGDSLARGQVAWHARAGTVTVPISSPVHGWIDSIYVGEGDTVANGDPILRLEPTQDPQSGVPVRSLTPLFIRYGVDAVIAGHDEIWERSAIEGVTVLPGGEERPHTLHVYDVGVGGDGLRAPQMGLQNPWQRFLAHRDAPEVWKDGILVEGGKHYGHLEVDVLPTEDGGWTALLKPVYVFPVFGKSAGYSTPERRLYDDIVTLTDTR